MIKRLRWSRFCPGPQVWIALASGLTMALCQSIALPVGQATEWGRTGWLDPLALVGLAPLLVVLLGVSAGRAFFLGVVAGTTYFGLSLSWLLNSMTVHGHIPLIGALPILLMLVVFLSLFWGLPFWACARIKNCLGIRRVWSLPLVFVAFEFARNYVFTGFPWAALGYTQVRSLWLVQLASLCGIYLVTFALVFSNSLLAELWIRRRQGRGWPVWPVVAWVSFMALAGAWSAWRLLTPPAPDDGQWLKAGVVQGNLDERARLRGPMAQRWVFDRMLAQSRLAQAQGAQLIAWPEGTLPLIVSAKTSSFARHPSPGPSLEGLLVAGGVGRSQDPDGQAALTNSAFVLDGGLNTMARYDKRHLVPFGEYVPLSSILPWQWFVPNGTVFFVPGTSHAPLDMGLGRLGMLICYEAIFPEIARESAGLGAQVLVNITNDSWFGASPCPYQHLAMSRVRSIETDRYQLRAANTGISALIDSRGRELDRLPLGLSSAEGDPLALCDLEPPAFLVGSVALLDSTTPYVFWGDWFAWLCALLTLLGLALTWRKARIEKRRASVAD